MLLILLILELCHAVGLIHEHQRHDRDNNIIVNIDNAEIDSSHPDLIKNQLIKWEQSTHQNYTAYDEHSATHYPSNAFSDQQHKLPTIISKNNVHLPQLKDKYGLSKADIRALKQFYNCPVY